MNDNCIFCKIVKGEIPSYKVYEDDIVLAFLDIRPVHEGHTLVIPKNHFDNIYTTPDEILEHISIIIKRISLAIKHTLNADGINIITNNESDAGQIIFHTHTHIIPRIRNDNLGIWPQKEYDEGRANQVLEKIKGFLK